jgi:hypothetical protein
MMITTFVLAGMPMAAVSTLMLGDLGFEPPKAVGATAALYSAYAVGCWALLGEKVLEFWKTDSPRAVECTRPRA